MCSQAVKLPNLKLNVALTAFSRAIEYIIPILIIPILINRLGIDGYGVIAIAQASAVLCAVIVDYGYALTSGRKISTMRHDVVRVSEIYWATQYGKLLFGGGVAVVVLLLGNFSGLYQEAGGFPVLACLVQVFGSIIFPQWLSQATEEIKISALIALICRMLSLIGIYFFVESIDDVAIAQLLIIGWHVPAGIFLHVYFIVGKKIVFLAPRSGEVKLLIIEALPIFKAQLSMAAFRNTGMLVLGNFGGSLVVGYYAVADKIVKAAQSTAAPIFHAVFPRLAYLAGQSPGAGEKLRKIVFFVSFSYGAIVSLAIYNFADEFCMLLSKSAAQDSVYILKIMAIIPLVGILNNFVGVQTLVAAGRSKEYSVRVVRMSLIGVFVVFVSVVVGSQVGAAYGYLLAEIIILFGLLRLVAK